MSSVVLCVKFKTLPGKRDELKNVWEKHVKPHAISSDALKFSCYSFVNEDPDSVILYEILADASNLKKSYEEDWFKVYLAEMGPLLAAPPEVTTSIPVWTKFPI